MSKVNKIETAARYLLACAILTSTLLPAQAQNATVQTSGPQQDLTQSSAPLFYQPNYEGDLRQHSFFAGNYRDPIQTGVGSNGSNLYWWQNLTPQTVYPGPTPISTGLIGDNINTTVQSSVPGLVSTAVAGAVVAGAAVGGAVAATGVGASSVGSSASAASTSVNGSVLDGTQF